ncbi:MAG: hypothetical protein DRQ60_05940 [Gammaproteobacteria bacterium]|nr:MAG: hypothetical protein DRQ54_04555 [Gammaproteobacteria bacterium]RLA14074.1 MAG: hypothetical protein DRQ52_04980 [Gammaproteobacteria bacterium]RLA15295.1 MAG: hypothetical protein DRQ60_05940 [Gammaproteobacteria bacterium]
MAGEISLQELARQPGIIGAARWKASQYSTNMAAAPVLVEFAGSIDRVRGERLMNNSEVAGMSVMGVGMLNKTSNPDDTRNVFPIDSYYINGQTTSMIATFNRVAVLLDNSVDYEVREVITLMNRVGN